MSDLIERQAAIDAIDRLDIPEDMCVFEILSHIELEIGNLPSAQPEIIRCKDCIKKPLCMIYRETNDDFGYCSWAGRKTE